jgi:ferrous iron transport protein B
MGIIERLLGESAPVITPETRVFPGTRKRLIIVGNPNVGKSVLFNCLTGTYATVSNYPGTSVEVSRGELRLATGDITVVDTPGMYALLPITEEERVARNILFQEKPDLVIHVLDAKNLERMLPFTLQLLEADLPVILVLNIFDEAEKMGMHINLAALEKQLGIPVRATVSTTGKGLAELKEIISRTVTVGKPIRLSAGQLEPVVQALEKELPGDLGLSRRALGMLLLQDDEEVSGWIQARDPEKYQELQGLVETAKASSAQPLSYLIAVERQNQASRIVKAVLEYSVRPGIPAVERISRFMIQPVTGLPILLLILYFGLYQFVGVFGAGVLVNFIERDLFEKMINPWVVRLLTHALPWKVLQELFIGEYGMITLGLRYAVALILPIHCVCRD